MNIQINEDIYTIREEAREQLFQWLLAEGSAQQTKFKEKHSAWYFTIKTLVRGILQYFEENMRKAGAPEAIWIKFRPEKRQNPLDLAQERLIDLLRNQSERFTLRIATSETGELTAFQFVAHQNQGGGSLDTDGDIGEWEDDGAEVSGRGLRATVPDESALCAG